LSKPENYAKKVKTPSEKSLSEKSEKDPLEDTIDFEKLNEKATKR